jgi:hypothetical protein
MYDDHLGGKVDVLHTPQQSLGPSKDSGTWTCRGYAAPAGIASSCAEVKRWAVGRIRDNPAYAQIQEKAREVSELKARLDSETDSP